ncbi:MAG: aldehyde dehydrogenase family protein [Sphingomonadaceae bacterium]|nr:aldehyde dehydrogenase family protein [Sphingomonadaceae bacterium]
MGSTAVKVRNPRTGDSDYEIAPREEADIIALARRLRDEQAGWSATGIDERSEALLRWSKAIAANSAAIAKALSIDTGRQKISQIEVDGAVRLIERWARSAGDIIAAAKVENRPTSIPGISTSTRLVPYPLVGAISPWNFPLTLALIDAIPALMAGCAVIVKPSEVTPRFIKPLMATLDHTPGIPLSVIEGDGVTGAALVRHVDYVAFTGSVATGRKVGAAAADAFIPASLELGGKDPMIILASTDPVQAAEIALRASVVNSGQACQSIERVYVAREIANPFLAALGEKAKAVRLNYPDIHSGDIGPFIFERQAVIVQAQIDDAVSKGAMLLAGGQVEALGGGLYLRPTVLANVTSDMTVMSEETFGPVIPVTIFDEPGEAIARANDGIYGLSASVLAGTAEEAEAVAAQLKAGAVSINDGSLTSMVWEAEKSSFGLSGLGPGRMGDSGLLRFFRKQALIRQSGTPLPLVAYSEGEGR